MKPLCCPVHPDGLIRHSYDLTQTVLNGTPSGEGVRSNHRYECADCGRELASLSAVSEAENSARRIKDDFERVASAICNGWRPCGPNPPTVDHLVKEFGNLAKERRLLYGEDDEKAASLDYASKRLSQVRK